MNHLSHLSILSFSGSDVKDFLQGQMTQDINSISNQSYKMTSILNPKGRMIVSGLIKRSEDIFFLIISKDLSEDILNWLSRYILRSDVIITIEDFNIIGLDNVNHKKLINHQDDSQQLNISPVDVDKGRYILIINNQVVTKDNSIQSINENDWILADIKSGLAIIDKNNSEKYIPQMINLDLLEGISFSKGCYTGQEVVARVQHRGKIKQRMFHIIIESNNNEIDVRSEVMCEDKKVGSIVISKKSNNYFHALAVINTINSDEDLSMNGYEVNLKKIS
ncbi:MAG: folate-binding protein YgfZ [Gammaproteobacteria bacterium]|nr:folate-binding protein YgfZ [Gammaproteobacteria bacterium]